MFQAISPEPRATDLPKQDPLKVLFFSSIDLLHAAHMLLGRLRRTALGDVEDTFGNRSYLVWALELQHLKES